MIRIERLPTTTVHREWGWLAPCLADAVRHDRLRTIHDVGAALVLGQMDAWVLSGAANGVAVTFESEDAGERWFWIGYVAGAVSGGPKQRLRTMAEVLGRFEDIARSLGLRGVRWRGRRWELFPDYTTTDHAGLFENRKAFT